MKKYIYLTAAVATLFASCDKENGIDQNLNGEICLTSANNDMVVSRAGTNIQSTQFLASEQISVFINEDVTSNPSTTYTQPLTYTANGTGGLTTTTAQYFPKSGNAVNIYACYPKMAAETVATPKDFTVQTDQSSDANYKSSDLMLGVPTKNPVKRVSTAIALTFTHQLAKANINLIAGKGLGNADLDRAVVKLKALMPTISFNPQTGTTGNATGSTADIKVMDAAIGTLSGSAIFVPQTVAKDAKFIEVTLASGGVLTYKLGEQTTFEKSKAYTYYITVNLTGLSVASTITGWTAIGAVTGDAEMLPESN